MHPKLIELVMQQEAELYNNIVDVEGCVGRLLVKLKIYPAPVITWDYEALGEDACRPDSDPISFRGTEFTIGEAYITQRSYGHLPTEPRKAAMKGVTTRATYGAPDEQFHSFQFYLPNATFHEVNLVGQGQIEELIRASADGDSWDVVGHGTAGRFITVELEHGWKIHLKTKKLALDWLGSQDSIGTLITTVGRLYYPRDESNAESNTPTMSMNEALEHLGLLSRLLSFANGGYLGPLYVESMRWDGDDSSVAAVALANRTTPIQLIGTSWLTIDSDLRAFLECLPTLRRMLAVSPWDEVFPLMLTWYFQAIQPSSRQVRGKPWPVIVNALGALLERLCVAILVRELGIRGLRTNAQRITRLLEQIGISQDTQHVQDFVNLRNNATHPMRNSLPCPEQINLILRRAVQWVEEAVLWRLGYGEKYRERIHDRRHTTEPRYDLGTRDPSW